MIIPVYNGGDDFRVCLESLFASADAPDEIIVIDDGSTDSSAQLAGQLGAKVLSLGDKPRGPAFARNRGAALARGDILVFIDADVAVHPDALGAIAEIMQKNPQLSALFGSYDDAPPKRGLVSRYKNLQHHFVHQNGQREATTFWAGCGAVRRDVFFNMGGFSEGYSRPSIEDIEFGLRLYNAGYRIWLCPEVLTTHLKQWNLLSLLRSDIRDRAIPWTKLILNSARLPTDLNLNTKSRLSVIVIGLFLAFLATGFWHPLIWFGALVSAAILVLLNLEFYRLLARRGGLAFTVGSIILHSFYYLYSSITFGILLVWHLLQKNGVKLAVFFQTVKAHKRTAV